MEKNFVFLSIILLVSSSLSFTMGLDENQRQEIKDVHDSFAGVSSQYVPQVYHGLVRYIEVIRGDATDRFFGIEKEDQKKVDFSALKTEILRTMQAPSGQILQVVGDSDYFSEVGLQAGRHLLSEMLAGDQIVEFGYTSRKKNKNETCINGMVNEFFDRNPDQASRGLANILGQTVQAIEEWGAWASPNIRNFVVVYNEGQGTDEKPLYEIRDGKFTGKQLSGFTTFGDDVAMSDKMCDRLICQEGGAQSFLQTVNVLNRNLPVLLVSGARKPDKNPFSAACFLTLVRNAFDGDNPPSKETVKNIFEEYVASFGKRYVEEVGYELPRLFNYNKGDWRSKKHLFEQAVSVFTGLRYKNFEFVHEEGKDVTCGEGLYQKIANLCSFVDAQDYVNHFEKE